MNDIDDPLWLNSPIKRMLFRAACYLVFIALCIGLFALALPSPWGVWVGAVVGLWFIASARQWLMKFLSTCTAHLRMPALHSREGTHHSFAGQPLNLHDDGRDMWMDEPTVRVLLQLQQDRAIKARFANHWRTAAELGLRGRHLWVRVSAVHQYLADAPERMDPKRVRLRTYLDREVLQTAVRRHERGS